MQSERDEPAADEAAEERVEAQVSFFGHLALYVVMVTLLALVNLVTAPGRLWFAWPALAWGVAVGLHFARVFAPGRAGARVRSSGAAPLGARR